MQRRRGFLLAAACLGLARPAARAADARPVRMVIIPKLVGIDYYDAVKKGIDDAVRDLRDVEVTWTGPTQDKVEKQIEIIDEMVARRPDVIAVAANDPIAIAPALQRAQRAGVHVMTWDADARVREFFVNLVDFEEFGSRLVEQPGVRRSQP